MFSVALAWKEEVTKKWHIHISIWWHSFWNILIEICSWYGNICQQFFKNSYFIFILLSFFRFILQNSTQDYLRFVSLVYVCFFGFFFKLHIFVEGAAEARLRCEIVSMCWRPIDDVELFLLYSRVVVSLIYKSFPFSILQTHFINDY